MKQSYKIIYSLALATLCASPWSTTLAQSRAGVKAGGFTVLKAEPKLSPIEQQRAFAKFKAEHPLLFKARVRGANLGGGSLRTPMRCASAACRSASRRQILTCRRSQ